MHLCADIVVGALYYAFSSLAWADVSAAQLLQNLEALQIELRPLEPAPTAA